ncbi:MAG: hypothetical protein JWM01_839 [Arthrobacter sp.]|jgi:hypothetical protein|nr:hypothetical protein [Arthrobacter sp.]MCU1553751.1 hypothetical protein [Arthrobacter sp.]
MKAHRTKRTVGVVGLLAALVLTASGCSTAPAKAKAQPVAILGQEPQKKVADYDPATAILDPEWGPAFGEDRAVSTPIAAAGIKILSAMFDEHPEYTVEGFVPTDANWNEAAARFKPLVDGAAFQEMETEWTSTKELPVLTSYGSGVDKDGKHTYTFTTESGQPCTYTAEPYATNMEGVSLTARPDESGTQVPVFSGHVTLAVSCKEGGILRGQMVTWFPMTKVGDAWLMMGSYESYLTPGFKIDTSGQDRG